MVLFACITSEKIHSAQIKNFVELESGEYFVGTTFHIKFYRIRSTQDTCAANGTTSNVADFPLAVTGAGRVCCVSMGRRPRNHELVVPSKFCRDHRHEFHVQKEAPSIQNPKRTENDPFCHHLMSSTVQVVVESRKEGDVQYAWRRIPSHREEIKEPAGKKASRSGVGDKESTLLLLATQRDHFSLQ